jgi:hypothetical protein
MVSPSGKIEPTEVGMELDMLLLTYQPTPAPDRENAKATGKQLKTKILKRMAQHLRERGRGNYDLIREDPEFASVIGRAAGESGRRKFFRWLERVGKTAPADTTRPHEDREVAEEQAAWAKRVAEEIHAANPHVSPSPAYIAKTGNDGRNRLNFVACAHQIFADIDLLRREALVVDTTAPGGVAVKDTALLDLSIRRAMQMLDTLTRVGSHMMDLDLNEEFYKMIIDIVVQEMPEDQMKATMHRLKDLNDTWATMKPSR